MKREELTRLVERLAREEGFAFHTGEIHTLNGTVNAWPAAWLAPPVVRDRTGRFEGEITRRITLHLAAMPDMNALPREAALSGASTEAVQLYDGSEASPPGVSTGIVQPGAADETAPLCENTESSLWGGTDESSLWAWLEFCAANIVSALASAPEVCSVSSVSCTPGRQILSAHGEISVTLVCDVRSWYSI